MASHLSPEEVRQVREALDRRRPPGAYEPGKWSVSRFDRQVPYPSSAILRDITLRVIEQTPVVSVDATQRLHLARQLLDAGLRHLEVSLGGWGSLEDLETELKTMRQWPYEGVELVYGGAEDESEIDLVSRAGINVVGFFNCVLPEMTPIYFRRASIMALRGEDWRQKYAIPTLQKQIDSASRTIEYIHKKGVKAAPELNGVALAEEASLEKLCRALEEAGANEIVLADSTKGLGPDGCHYIVALARRAAPNTKISVHVHNQFGLGTATCLAAIQAGADIVDVAVNSVGSAYGQADLAEVAVCLEALHGVKTGVKLERLTHLRRLVEDLTGIPMPPNKPITGERVWVHVADIGPEEAFDPLLHTPIEPTLVGNQRRLTIGKVSNDRLVHEILESHGIQVPIEGIAPISRRVKQEIAIRRRELTAAEMTDIARSAMTDQGD